MAEKATEFTMIVPAAADKTENPNHIPGIFTTDREGIMHCVKAILGINPDSFDTIYFTVLRKHVEAFDIDLLLNLQFRRLGIKNARIIILDEPTPTQAATVAATIREADIHGAVFIKDADCFFAGEILPENGVAVYPLEQLSLVDPRNKSYVAVDDMQHITNIIEKRIVSNLFNAGGYCFADAEDFMKAYEQYRGFGNIYLSHLIYALLLSGHTFRPIKVAGYSDLNIPSWKNL